MIGSFSLRASVAGRRPPKLRIEVLVSLAPTGRTYAARL
jgi:hypothetical protein